MTAYDSACLPLGTRLDQHYVICGLLGRGGFGITYVIRDELLESQFALKEFFPEELVHRDGTEVRFRSRARAEADFAWGKRKFFDEARLLAQFNHPNIVSVRRVFEANDTAYMILDLVQGITLEDWLNQLDSPPTQIELDFLSAPLLSALELVHKNRAWHLDISPDNIMIRSADGTPVLLDFGASRFELKRQSQLVSALVFKSGYSAPEQYTSKADQYGAWTDIYAFGATLYRAVTGQRPSEATARQMADDLEPAAELAKGRYRDGFLTAIDQALRLAPAERPQSIVEWSRPLLEGSTVANRFVAPRSVLVREASQQTDQAAAAPLKSSGGKKIAAAANRPRVRSRWPAALGILGLTALAAGGGLYSGYLPARFPSLPEAPTAAPASQPSAETAAERKSHQDEALKRLEELKRIWTQNEQDRKIREERERQEAALRAYTPNEECREFLSSLDDKPLARSIAVAENGHCGFSHGYRSAADAEAEAMKSCSSRHGGECRTLRTDGGDWTPRDTCSQWLDTPAIRALAVAQNGMCGWASGYSSISQAKQVALDSCEKIGEKCRITDIFEGDWSLNEACQTSYKQWLRMRGRGAFAVSQSGLCGYSYGYPNTTRARNRALQECGQLGMNCKVTAVK